VQAAQYSWNVSEKFGLGMRVVKACLCLQVTCDS
jgi:hypothetical protein